MTDRDGIVAEIQRLSEPHLYESGFNKSLDSMKGLFGPKRPLRIFRDQKLTLFDGFILTEMLALSEDGPITDAVGGGCVVTGFSDLPVEDLILLREWAKQKFG